MKNNFRNRRVYVALIRIRDNIVNDTIAMIEQPGERGGAWECVTEEPAGSYIVAGVDYPVSFQIRYYTACVFIHGLLVSTRYVDAHN